MTVQTVSLSGITISKADALELVNRMNAKWPGKYWLEWNDAPYSNNAYNPLMGLNHYHAQAANPYL